MIIKKIGDKDTASVIKALSSLFSEFLENKMKYLKV